MLKEKEIIEGLKILKKVEPEPDFVKNTRHLVLTVKPHMQFAPIWVAGFALAAIILAIISSKTFFAAKQPAISSSFNENSLVEEFNEMSINLQIKEITYSQNIHNTIASALTEISDYRTNHMNTSVLEAEQKYINNKLEVVNDNEEIDALLNRVIF